MPVALFKNGQPLHVSDYRKVDFAAPRTVLHSDGHEETVFEHQDTLFVRSSKDGSPARFYRATPREGGNAWDLSRAKDREEQGRQLLQSVVPSPAIADLPHSIDLARRKSMLLWKTIAGVSIGANALILLLALLAKPSPPPPRQTLVLGSH